MSIIFKYRNLNKSIRTILILFMCLVMINITNGQEETSVGTKISAIESKIKKIDSKIKKIETKLKDYNELELRLKETSNALAELNKKLGVTDNELTKLNEELQLAKSSLEKKIQEKPDSSAILSQEQIQNISILEADIEKIGKELASLREKIAADKALTEQKKESISGGTENQFRDIVSSPWVGFTALIISIVALFTP